MKKPLFIVALVAVAASILLLLGLALPAVKETLEIGVVSETVRHTGWLATFGGTKDYGVTGFTAWDYKASVGLIFAYSCALLGGVVAIGLGTRSRFGMVFASMHFFAAMILLILNVVFFVGANGFSLDNPVRTYVMTWENIVEIVIAGLAGLWTFFGAFAGITAEVKK